MKNLENGKIPDFYTTTPFQPMGLNLRLISNSQAVLEAVEISFGGFGPAQASESPDFTFYLFEHEVDDGHLTQPVFRTEGPLVYQTMGQNSTLVADREQGVAHGYFSATTLANLAFFRWHFLELAFFVMLQARGFMGVHGAALAKNGRAILLRAPSGGGKTTLAYAGARSKFQALAEDVVWLDLKRNRWWGMPWSFHLLPDAKNLFPELAPYQAILQTNGEMKLEINLEKIRVGSTTVSARPGPVVLVERLPGGESQLEPIDLTEARPIWLAGSAGAEMDFPDYHQHVNNLLNNNTYRLYFGDDITASVSLLESLFEH